MKGYIIKAKDKDRFYRGSVRGNYRSCGFHVKIYKSIKNALKALQYVKKHDKNFNYSQNLKKLP